MKVRKLINSMGIEVFGLRALVAGVTVSARFIVRRLPAFQSSQVVEAATSAPSLISSLAEDAGDTARRVITTIAVRQGQDLFEVGGDEDDG